MSKDFRTPRTIKESKYPRQKYQNSYDVEQRIDGDIYRPKYIKDNEFPYKRIVDETRY